MAKLDRSKEEIAYLKLWLGIAVLADISLFSWLVSIHEAESIFRLICATIGVLIITLSGLRAHHLIEDKIRQLEGI